MALPRIDVHIGVTPRSIILLSGFKRNRGAKGDTRVPLEIDSEEKLLQSARRNPDAVAFGFIGGKWIPAA
jgi:hypothetical protein